MSMPLTSKTYSLSQVHSIARQGDAIRLNNEICKACVDEVLIDFKGKTVLDVACGHENPFFKERLQLAKHVIGLDQDSREIQRNQFIHEGHVGDIHAMPLPGESVDVVVSVDTIEHAAEPDLFLKECHRVLRAGGEAVFATPNLLGYKNAFAKFCGKNVFDFAWRTSHDRVLEYGTFYRCNTAGTFRQKAQEAGFQILTIKYVPEISWFLSTHPIAFTLAHVYNRAAGRLGLERLWGYMVVRAVKI
jgi:2-polyprenyl-3-methyl-5-hydroxy-6-metoxy-1,4-benzoquinol methylase